MQTVTERFLRYVTFPTASAEAGTATPSTPGQQVLADALAAELTALGLADVVVDEYAYVYAVLPASPGCADLPARMSGSFFVFSAKCSRGENFARRIIRTIKNFSAKHFTIWPKSLDKPAIIMYTILA